MKGHLRPDLASHYRVGLRDFLSGSVPGSELLVPVERVGAPPVLVDLGWVPQHGPPLALPTGDAATITGYVRPAVHVGFFGTTDDAGTRLFTILDPGVIGPALGLPTMAPFTVIALGPPPKDPGVPIPAEHLPRPENNHLQYAITWYSLAVVLLLVFSRYAMERPSRMTAYRAPRCPLRPHRHRRRGGGRAVLGQCRDDAARRGRRPRRPACRAGRPRTWAADRAGRGRRHCRGRAAGRSVACRQPRPDAARPHACHGHPARSGGGAGARQFGLREGLAGGPPYRGLPDGRGAACRGGEPDAATGGGVGAGARPVALRRPDGRVPARHRGGRRGAGVRGLSRVPGRRPAARRSPAGGPPRADPAARPVPGGRAGGALPPSLRGARDWSRNTPGSTARPIHFAAAHRPTCASPPATAKTTSRRA